MNFTRTYFDPAAAGEAAANGTIVCRFDDPGRPTSLYVYDERLVFAINVALAAKRPLLLAGEPGCGKTTLARNVARVLGWWYYEQVIGSRTQASDLLWEHDALRLLNDATDPNRQLLTEGHYVEPGRLWWALDPVSAARRGMPEIDPGYALPDPGEPGVTASAVVLLDEIDKAEPDVPNDLLEILDTRSFHVRDTPITATRDRVLVMLTTNGERELPGAFQRRCIAYRFADPKAEWYVEVANRWHGPAHERLHQNVAGRLMESRTRAHGIGQRLPGTAEYLDAVAACARLGVDPLGNDWDELARAVLDKHLVLDPQASRV